MGIEKAKEIEFMIWEFENSGDVDGLRPFLQFLTSILVVRHGDISQNVQVCFLEKKAMFNNITFV